jgi:dephospho-CoA kinase
MPVKQAATHCAIILTGDLGAGKSTAAHYIATRYRYQHLSFVEKIWKPLLQQRNLPFTRSNLQLLGIELMNNKGPQEIVQLLLHQADPNRDIVIDDVRRKDVVEIFKEKCNKIFVIYLQADFETRYIRLVERDNVKSRKEQQQAEQVETETTIHELEGIADIVIKNVGNINDFYKQLDEAHNQAMIKFNKLAS